MLRLVLRCEYRLPNAPAWTKALHQKRRAKAGLPV